VFGFSVYIQETCLLKAARAFLVIKALEDMGEVIATDPSSQDIEDEKFDFCFSLFTICDNDIESAKAAIMSVSEIEEAVGEEYTTEMMQNFGAGAAAESSEAGSEETKEEAPEVKKPTFGIVLASQVSQKNADSFMELLNEKGFNEAYITNVRFRRVVYGHFATKDDALNQLRQLRQQSRKLFGEGWVMKN
jgi:septal ring-binding cell division protein DamX